MTSSSSTSFTPAEGRRFALTVGIAFELLAGLLYWRGRDVALQVFGGLGVALLIAGVLVPGRLGPLYRGWMRMALVISKVTTPIFMAVVYFVVLTPAGLAMRTLGRSPIRHRPVQGSFWQSTLDKPKGDLRRQF